MAGVTEKTMKYIAISDGIEQEEGELKLNDLGDIPNTIMGKTGMYNFDEVFMDNKSKRLTALYVMNS